VKLRTFVCVGLLSVTAVSCSKTGGTLPEAVPTTAATEETTTPTSSATTDTTLAPQSTAAQNTVPGTSTAPSSVPETAPSAAAAAIERFRTNTSTSDDLQFLLPTADGVSTAMKLETFSQTRDSKASLFQTLALASSSVTQGGWVREVQTSSGSEMIRFEAQLAETPAKAAALAVEIAALYKKAGVTPDSSEAFKTAFPAGSLGTSGFAGAFNVATPERPCRAVATGSVSRVVFLTYVNSSRCSVKHTIEAAAFVSFSVQSLQALAAQSR
jgi:hypothetical protein